MGTEGEQHIVVSTHETTVHMVGPRRAGRSRKPCYMQKDGRCPVDFVQVPGEWGLYLADIYTTLVEIRWRVMFLIFSLSYILSWLTFALLYWLVALVHKDLWDTDNAPCVDNVRSFTAAFLFSMETQATIGYGFRGMTENCAAAIVVVTVHDVLSCFIDTAVIGVAVAKMASPRKRTQTVGFSKCAVVGLRDGALCLAWRLGDFRSHHILEGTARAQLVRHAKDPSSGVVSLSYQNLDIQNRDVVLATPVTLVHRLERGSPLYTQGPDGLPEEEEEDFELVVSFTYTGDSTGILHQTRTAYTPADIRWGQRFEDMVSLGKRHYKVDYALFHQTVWAEGPMVSAEDYDREKVRAQRALPPSAGKPSGIGRTRADVTEEAFQEAWL